MSANLSKLRSTSPRALNHSSKLFLQLRTPKKRPQTYCLKKSSTTFRIKKNSSLSRLRNSEKWMRASWLCLITSKFSKTLPFIYLRFKGVKLDLQCMAALWSRNRSKQFLLTMSKEPLYSTKTMFLSHILPVPLRLKRRLDWRNYCSELQEVRLLPTSRTLRLMLQACRSLNRRLFIL